MNLSDYKDYLTKAIAVEATFISGETARGACETLVEHLREMDMNDQYMQDAWRAHGELPDDAQRTRARSTIPTSERTIGSSLSSSLTRGSKSSSGNASG